MSNIIFESLLIEQINHFRSSFSNSKNVFYNKDTKSIFHNGEYGTYRESIVKDFLKFIIPSSLDISTGFLITSLDDVSTQCDVVIFDSQMTPLYEGGNKQRFFPMETVHAIGEVKSTMSKKQFRDALNKLAKIKSLSERSKSTPHILRSTHNRTYDPINNPYDVIPSFIICQKLDFNLKNISDEIDSFYEDNIEIRHKHNMILSIEDGLITYFNPSNNKLLPYSKVNNLFMKNRLILPKKNEYIHFKFFASFMFMITSSKTLFYPEISDYMETNNK